ARMNEQGQECLQAHVAEGRQRVARVGDALYVEPAKGRSRPWGTLLQHGDRSTDVLLVEGERPAALLGEDAGEEIGRNDGREQPRGEAGRGGRAPGAGASALRARRGAEYGPREGKPRGGAKESEPRHQDKPRYERAGDPARRV